MHSTVYYLDPIGFVIPWFSPVLIRKTGGELQQLTRHGHVTWDLKETEVSYI